ncbi:hypothetical protein Cgig2_001378 [Carnegiea gigantea]|uniref:Uncharacterized protein n=1 Tax=Carnegiea gigantea TaxID=171969 RepID=A0A9Q1KUL8_9CARY|nr:hypothetical protein Cgig2_001378 [Carnegiea gigantea]
MIATIIIHRNPHKKVAHQFYFVKLCPSFVDPALKEKIEKSNDLLKRMDRVREIISREIRSIEVKMHEKRDEIDRLRRYGNFDVQYLMSFVEGLLQQFEIQWPGENKDIDLDQDLEVVDDIVDDINVDEKIEELSNTLNHGRRNLAEERRILRELKVMQRRKKHHDHPVKPTTFQRPRWNSKERIQQRILTALKQARDTKERERKLIEEYEAIKDETHKPIMPLKEKEAEIDRKKARANPHLES